MKTKARNIIFTTFYLIVLILNSAGFFFNPYLNTEADGFRWVNLIISLGMMAVMVVHWGEGYFNFKNETK